MYYFVIEKFKPLKSLVKQGNPGDSAEGKPWDPSNPYEIPRDTPEL